MIYILLALFAIYFLWVIALWFMQDELVFPRTYAAEHAGDLERPGVEVVWVESKAGPIPGWFFRGEGASEASPTGAIVILHGNAMCIDDWFDDATHLAGTGINVLLPEYRGYGKAPGSPTQEAITTDITAFVELLSNRAEVHSDRIIYYGRSIGSAIAAQVALRHPPAGLILHTPPTSIARYATRYGAPSFLMRNPFRTDRALPLLSDVPLLIIAHESDSLVDRSQPMKLKEIAPHAEFLEVGGTHNVFASRADEEAFQSARLLFIERLIR